MSNGKKTGKANNKIANNAVNNKAAIVQTNNKPVNETANNGKENKKYLPIVKNTKYFVSVSVGLILIGLVLTGILGLNWGIDFKGGTMITVNMGQKFDTNDVVSALNKNKISDAQVVASGEGAVKDKAIIRMKDLNNADKESELRTNIVKDLKGKYSKVQLESYEKVGATAGKTLTNNALLSVLFASILILAYIWIRFELLSGVAAVIALIHDLCFMVAAVAILRVPVNSSFIAAMLTILGYSINDTIVVFDRIRENNRKYSRRDKSRAEIVDMSVTQTLTRSLNSSLTVIFTTIVLYILGVESIKEFALPLLVGLVTGTYSSIFIASPIWCKWADRWEMRRKNTKMAVKRA